MPSRITLFHTTTHLPQGELHSNVEAGRSAQWVAQQQSRQTHHHHLHPQACPLGAGALVVWCLRSSLQVLPGLANCMRCHWH